jgi:hypothetical protein
MRIMMFYVHLLVSIKSIFIREKIFFILGNKIDINQREIPIHVAEQFAENNDMWYLETSAKNSENVGRLFQTIAEELTLKAQESAIDVSNNVHNAFPRGDQETKSVKSNCC